MSPKVTLADIEDAKAKALSDFLAQENKANPGEVSRLSDAVGLETDVVPTGAVSLDVALGAGGFPMGRVIELYGPEMGGKTTIALAVAANAQRLRGGAVGFIDAEHALNPQHALDMKIDPHRFVIEQPDYGEAAIAMVERMAHSGAFDVIIVDSIAGLIPKDEFDGSIEDSRAMGSHAKMISTFMRRVSGPIKQNNVMLILINQLREKPGAYGNPEYTTGGRSIKFYASVRIDIRSGNTSRHIKVNGVVVGQIIDAKVTKNKVGPPFRTASFDLYYRKGFDSAGSMLEVAVNLGVIDLKGRTHTEVATGEVLGTSKDAAKTTLRENPELAARVEKAIYAALRTTGSTVLEYGEPSEAESPLLENDEVESSSPSDESVHDEELVPV